MLDGQARYVLGLGDLAACVVAPPVGRRRLRVAGPVTPLRSAELATEPLLMTPGLECAHVRCVVAHAGQVGVGLIEGMPADDIHVARQRTHGSQEHGFALLLRQFLCRPRAHAWEITRVRSQHHFSVGAFLAQDGDSAAGNGQVLLQVGLRTPVHTAVPLVPYLEHLDALAILARHIAHVARPGLQCLRRGRRLWVLVIPLPQLWQLARRIFIAVQAVAKPQRQHDVHAALHQVIDCGVRFGVNGQLAFLLLHPVPVHRVIVIADANPLHADVGGERPKPVMFVARLPQRVLCRADGDAGAARGQRHVLACRVDHIHPGDGKRIQPVLHAPQLPADDPDLFGRLRAEITHEFAFVRRIAAGAVEHGFPRAGVAADLNREIPWHRHAHFDSPCVQRHAAAVGHARRTGSALVQHNARQRPLYR